MPISSGGGVWEGEIDVFRGKAIVQKSSEDVRSSQITSYVWCL